MCTHSVMNSFMCFVSSQILELCTRFDWIDVDKDNKCSPYHVTEFVNDIFEHYRKREVFNHLLLFM